jgi:hypothetical protein
MLLCTKNDNQLISLCKKWIDIVQINFHTNANIEWNCMQLEVKFNSIQIYLNSIQSKNWIKIAFN